MVERTRSPSVAQLRREYKALNTNFIGPRLPGSRLQSGGTVFKVDFGPVAQKLAIAFSELGTQVRTVALVRALNHESGPLFTAVKRDLAAQTGAKYSRVGKALKERKASLGRLEYRIEARDTAIALSEFASRGMKPGQKHPYASPWNKGRSFRNAFVVKFGGGQVEIVKRVTLKHPRGSPLGAKKLWGAIIPKEMIRPNSPTINRIATALPMRIIPRLRHEYDRAVAIAKAKSGT